MTKLNQIIAVETGVKAAAQRAVTDLYRVLDKAPLFTGISRKYTPKDDDGDPLPPESTLVQVNVPTVTDALSGALTRLFDVTLTKETANTKAAADVTIDGVPLLTAVPVTYLLFLDKQLVDLATFIGKLPTLDPASRWTVDPNTGNYVAGPVQTVRTQKVRKNWVKADAVPPNIPAQVEVFHEDEIVGTWEKFDYSGAIPAIRKQELLQRVATLQMAVKYAREQANSMEITDVHAGETVLGWLFA